MILFCDIDGILNGHQAHPNGYCGTYPECVKQFNHILDEFPDLKLVISSAWRYLVHNGCMTLLGFENMLLTHGVKCRGRIVGITRKDFEERIDPRENQIMDWVKIHKPSQWLVIDDLDLRMDNFFWTDGEVGLTEQDACEIIHIIRCHNEDIWKNFN